MEEARGTGRKDERGREVNKRGQERKEERREEERSR